MKSGPWEKLFRSAAFRKSYADFEAQMEKDLDIRSRSCLCTTPFLTIFLKSLYWYEAILKQTVFQVMPCLCHRCLTQDQDAALPKIWSWRYMSTFGYSICNVHLPNRAEEFRGRLAGAIFVYRSSAKDVRG